MLLWEVPRRTSPCPSRHVGDPEPDPPLRDHLLSTWRRTGTHTSHPHDLAFTPKVLCHADGLADYAALQEDHAKIRRQFHHDCERYVLNYLPTHLLRVSDMSLVTRTEFWEAEWPRIQDSLEEHLVAFARPVRDEVADDVSSDTTHARLRSDAALEAERDAYVRELFKFAIFSHCWGTDEPLFHDILGGYLIRNPTIGYEKLRRFCQMASTDFDCRYVWSDTCCINKESSVEMDEAIRSMYRWYSIATVCIVHLAQSLTIDDFESEPWFTRGWTLQELLAPRVIRFYGQDWEPVFKGEQNARGDKAIKEVWSAIENVTGVSQTDLWHFSPSCDRVAEKMAWASQRRTTKIEDAAYSLLGLFNVSLPIAYGEADRAWYRLMTVIANECTDASFFAWAGQPSPYSRALPCSPASYSRLDPRTPASLFNRRHPSYQVTKLGVSIKMLVIPARCNVLEDGDGRDVGYTVVPHNLEPFLVGAHVPRGRTDEYRLGIVSFRFAGDAALVMVGDECHCLLLTKEHIDDQGWFLVSTECVVVVRCLEAICMLPETVLLCHGALPRRAHRYYPDTEMID